MMAHVGAIELTEPENETLKSISFDHKPHDDEAYLANVKAVPQLMDMLIKRKAIPRVRIQYFTDPAYHFGRMKGSYESILRNNDRSGDPLFENHSFWKYLKYFLYGADLPAPVKEEFSARVKSLGNITSDDVQELWELAKDLSNRYRLEPHEKAEEFYKLCLDCNVHLMHARHVREVVRKMKLQKSR